MARRHPVVLSTRTGEPDAALVRAVAQADGVSVCEAVRRLLIPAARKHLKEFAAAGEEDPGREASR